MRSTFLLGCLFASLGLMGWMANPLAQNVNTTNFQTSQVSVALTATQVAINRSRSSVTVENLGANQVCLGPTNAVTLANGICLPGTLGASITIPYTGAVWGIATTGATTVAVMDLF